jgi:hypothetical protein
VADTAMETRSRIGEEAPPDSGNGDEQPPLPQEAALLEALRRFVRQAAHQPEPPEEEPSATKRVGRFQAVVLVVVVLDMVLLYSEFQEWFENPLFLLTLKVLPWLLGATAFAYSDKVREWILAQCERKWVAVMAVLIALPLLIVRQGAFSVIVSVDSDSIIVKAADPNDRLVVTEPLNGLFRVTFPDLLKPYRITLEDSDKKRDSLPFVFDLGRWRVVRGTLAQIPLIGKVFGDAKLRLTPLYRIITDSTKSGGAADIEGRFEDGFLQQASLTELRCSPARSTKAGDSAIHCNVKEGFDAFRLPPGRYEFTLFREGCKDHSTISKEVRETENDEIKFDDLCP